MDPDSLVDDAKRVLKAFREEREEALARGHIDGLIEAAELLLAVSASCLVADPSGSRPLQEASVMLQERAKAKRAALQKKREG